MAATCHQNVLPQPELQVQVPRFLKIVREKDKASILAGPEWNMCCTQFLVTALATFSLVLNVMTINVTIYGNKALSGAIKALSPWLANEHNFIINFVDDVTGSKATLRSSQPTGIKSFSITLPVDHFGGPITHQLMSLGCTSSLELLPPLDRQVFSQEEARREVAGLIARGLQDNPTICELVIPADLYEFLGGALFGVSRHPSIISVGVTSPTLYDSESQQMEWLKASPAFIGSVESLGNIEELSMPLELLGVELMTALAFLPRLRSLAITHSGQHSPGERLVELVSALSMTLPVGEGLPLFASLQKLYVGFETFNDPVSKAKLNELLRGVFIV